MLTIEQAKKLLFKEIPPLKIIEVKMEKSLGFVLAEDIVSDIDMPPFDKSAMDGFAVRSMDLKSAPCELDVIEDLPAGSFPTKIVGERQCTRIMTGAPVPKGADAVLIVEKTKELSRKKILANAIVRPGENICAKGQDMKNGETVLKKGHLIHPQEVAIISSCGKIMLKVFAKPSCAVMPTGNELVEPNLRPSVGMIRNSNGYSLKTQIESLGMTASYLGIARDNLTELKEKIGKALEQYDVLIISGGVSVGEYDFVKQALSEEDVKMVVYQIAIKPGKPFYFGMRADKRIFALSGNPVSSFVTFEVFVRPFLLMMSGHANAHETVFRARLTKEVVKPLNRIQYIPGKFSIEKNILKFEPVHYTGSADIFALAESNAFVIVPIETTYKIGDEVDVVLMR